MPELPTTISLLVDVGGTSFVRAARHDEAELDHVVSFDGGLDLGLADAALDRAVVEFVVGQPLDRGEHDVGVVSRGAHRVPLRRRRHRLHLRAEVECLGDLRRRRPLGVAAAFRCRWARRRPDAIPVPYHPG